MALLQWASFAGEGDKKERGKRWLLAFWFLSSWPRFIRLWRSMPRSNQPLAKHPPALRGKFRSIAVPDSCDRQHPKRFGLATWHWRLLSWDAHSSPNHGQKTQPHLKVGIAPLPVSAGGTITCRPWITKQPMEKLCQTKTTDKFSKKCTDREKDDLYLQNVKDQMQSIFSDTWKCVKFKDTSNSF